MTVTFHLSVPGYAQRTGNLLLFRSCVLGRKGSSILEGKPRKQPLAFSYASTESDKIEISFPEGHAIDEMPKSVKYDYPFAMYRSETKASAHALEYARSFERKEVRIPLDKLSDLKKLYADIADDERGYAILHAPQ